MSALVQREGFYYPVREGRPQNIRMPSGGDFVILCLNPTLSVDHLDAEAKREAAMLPVHKYVAILFKGIGLPMLSRPTNQYYTQLVRDPSLPVPSTPDSRFDLPRDISTRLSAPIHALDDPRPQGLQPAADFPFPGCELDLSTGDLPVRVTTARRDCTRILSLPFLEVEHLQYLKGEVQKTLEVLKACDKISPDFDLQPDSAIVHQKFPILRLPNAGEGRNDQDVLNEASVNRDNDDLDGAPFSIFLARQNYFGGLNMPVVDVYYDISEVTSIRDPSLFYRDQRALYEIVERATNRMLQASAMAAADDQCTALPSNRNGNLATSRTSDWDSEQPPPQVQTFADVLSHSVTPRKRRGSSPPVAVKRQAMVDWN